MRRLPDWLIMIEHTNKLTPEEQRRRVKLKWDLLANASTDEAVTGGPFRFMFRVLQQLDLQTWTCTISDDRLCAELPGCRNRKTAEDHRAAIVKAGYWTTDSGSGRHATRYFIAEEIPGRAIAELTAKKEAFRRSARTDPSLIEPGSNHPEKANLAGVKRLQISGSYHPPFKYLIQVAWLSGSRMRLLTHAPLHLCPPVPILKR